ncbi:MAG: site-2 protease family protein [Actinomycetaceae bacterium]|nr:site-2 protease family protein [Actinomycetaceae bacterium]
MASLPGIVLFIIGLLISVAIHELGHLIPAKIFRVPVPRYFVGFGPTLWSTQRNGTEWGIKAFPLGGFVSIAGMLAPAKPGVKTHDKHGQLTIAEQARRESAAELRPGEEHRAFWRLPARKKFVVMFGGPFTNAALAFILLGVVVLGPGLVQLTNQISAVSQCVNNADSCSVEQQSPALGVFEAGDTILIWDGIAVENWADIQRAIADSEPVPTDVVIIRDGVEQTVTVTPVLTERPVITDAGQVQTDEQGNPVTEMRPYVGISPAMERERGSLGDVPVFTWQMMSGTAGVIAKLPVHLWNTVADLVTGQERDATSIVGIIGIADMAGSITATQATDYDLVDRFADLLILLAALNTSLFIFNMLPLLPLDGGHLAGATIEGVRRHVARWRGQPDPGAFDTARLLPLSNAVIIFFIGMTLLLVIADILNPVV